MVRLRSPQDGDPPSPRLRTGKNVAGILPVVDYLEWGNRAFYLPNFGSECLKRAEPVFDKILFL